MENASSFLPLRSSLVAEGTKNRFPPGREKELAREMQSNFPPPSAREGGRNRSGVKKFFKPHPTPPPLPFPPANRGIGFNHLTWKNTDQRAGFSDCLANPGVSSYTEPRSLSSFIIIASFNFCATPQPRPPPFTAGEKIAFWKYF